jgi:hypothetical protein
MIGAAIRRFAALAAVLVVAGCAHPTGGRKGICIPCFPGCTSVESNLLERGTINADVPLLSGEAMAPLPVPMADVATYRLLAAEECQCTAAAYAVTAYLVDVERQLALASMPARPNSLVARGLRVHQQVLALRAAQIRNEAAGDALDAFYQLAGAEASADVVDRSRLHVRQLIHYVSELEGGGLPSPLNRHDLQQQELELLSRRAELEWNISRLNGKLRLLMGWCLDGSVRIWPRTDLIVVREPIDVHAAVATGMASRADLATLRLLYATLDRPTLPLVRGALQTQDATLGNVTSGSARLLQLFRPARGQDEMRARRAQLSALLAEKERELAVGIHALVGAVEMHRDQAVFARRTLEISRIRLAELQQLRSAGQATQFEVSAQEGKVLEAEGALVQSAAEWRLAEVKLRREMGILAQECCAYGGPETSLLVNVDVAPLEEVPPSPAPQLLPPPTGENPPAELLGPALNFDPPPLPPSPPPR